MSDNNINDDIRNMNAENTDNTDIDDIEAAYAADMERKNLREEELQAARDYVGVILEEAEGRSRELEGKKQEASKLAERLSVTESEIAELKLEANESGKRNRYLTFWMCFSLIEMIMIAGLVIAMYLNLQDPSKNTGSTENPKNNEIQVATPTAAVTPDPSKATAFHVDNLEERVKYVSADSIAPFTVGVEKIDELEYLVFTCGDTKVAYRNEYYTEDINNRKWILIETGNDSRYMLAGSYDLDKDMVELCPGFTDINNRRLLAFVDYAGGIRNGIPERIRLIDTQTCRVYECNNLKDRIGGLMKVGVTKGLSVFDDAPYVYMMTTSKASYKFAVSEAEYNEIQYNDYEVPEFASEFVLNVNSDGIDWETEVKLGENLYMGKLTGKLILSESGLSVSGAKFGAYVPFNQEDEELAGYIRTADRVPKRYVTITGVNNERFLIEVDEQLALCNYYWDNLNTDDSNNWIYYDADGNKASWRGIDVSKYQGNIDWEKVAAEGIEFAIIRLGFRGMNEGTLELDNYFLKNIKGALENNIKVGIYFFSQAVDEEEALEEADFVLDAIRDYDITYPVVFDTERVSTFNARANGLSVAERTSIARTFCDTIAKAGYKPMIYANTKYFIMGLDLAQLEDYDKWYALYSSDVTYPYDFQIFQYSETGSVSGIDTDVDLNISFVDYSEQ